MRATPTVIGKPTSSRDPCAQSGGDLRAVCRRSATARPTSMNASSIDIGSTIGEVSRKTSNTARLAVGVGLEMRGDTSIRFGHRRRAALPDIAVRTPNALAS